MPDKVVMRQTGRTTRMLEAAMEQAAKGEYVCVVSRDHSQAESLRDQCVNLGATRSGGNTPPKVRVNKELASGEITFETVGDAAWSWSRLRHQGMWPNVPVFLDHYAIEAEFGQMLWELHRWDEEV